MSPTSVSQMKLPNAPPLLPQQPTLEFNSQHPLSKTSQKPLPAQKPVPSLFSLCVVKLADSDASLTDLSGLDEYAGGAILREILMRQRLTFRLANVFINSFPETELSAALQSLDLYAGLPPPAHR
eukprot:CAMPEP_0171624166 /NCGR_PEP_ID=MMETSP0990-20121206/18442_1 /TAXON_ID=483369 /ORGANISM="non described non described, Strain CCMP2098" /LENGTH=124 /DNA_ID=CAMNT_0012190633 /DNA_START=236 /DNA_END=610 /DNA_ORIENTATION=+